MFLKLNGRSFVGAPIHFAQQLEAVADPSVSDDTADEQFGAWLRERIVSTASR